MTGTSKALKRLGVAGLSAVVATVGLGTMTATSAFAAAQPGASTSVALDKHTDTAAVGTCNAFTATVNAGSVLTVQIQQSLLASGPAPNAAPAHSIGFCTPTAPVANDSAGTGPVATPGTPGANTAVNANPAPPAAANGGNCYNSTTPPAPPAANTSASVSCYSQFTDANNDGKIVFGVRSTDAGTMSIDAFGDTNAAGTIGVHDVTEPGDAATKTWVANTPNASTNKITCTPATATNPAGTQHKFTCTVTDANGVAISGATNVNFQIASGPDAGISTTSPGGSGATCSTTGNNNAGAPANAGTNTTGVSECSYTNNGTPGTDQITAYLEQNGQTGLQSGGTEPNTTISKTWVLPAPQTSVVSLDCSPNETQAASSTNSGNSACTLPPSTKSATLTAKVVNGSPAAPVSGAVVTFTVAQTGGPVDANDTEAVSPTSCTTDSSGTCTTTFTDSAPVNGEQWTVTASIPRQGAANDTATSTITFHTATEGEARNITVAPASASQQSGGVQAFTATVTDRFGGPIQGVCVAWTESGPGRFTGNSFTCGVTAEDANGNATQTDAACLTAANGQCSVEVTSQPSEVGSETITASIRTNNTDFGGNPVAFECNAPAGFSYFNGVGTFTRVGTTPNANGANNAQTGAKAGNCTAQGTVSWTAGAPTGAASVTVSAANGRTGKLETATATVKDASGAAVANQVVQFSVTGANNATGSATTNASGVATFSYTPRAGGHDTITALVNNGSTNPSGSRTIAIQQVMKISLACGSPKKHVVNCKVTTVPARSGLHVTLFRVTSHGNVRVASGKTNSNGVVRFTVRNQPSGKKGYRAVLAGTATTTSAKSGRVVVFVKK